MLRLGLRTTRLRRATVVALASSALCRHLRSATSVRKRWSPSSKDCPEAVARMRLDPARSPPRQAPGVTE